MTEVTKYICDVCNTEYSTGEEALECEGTHSAVVETEPTYGAKAVYPAILHVKFENEETMTYCLSKV